MKYLLFFLSIGISISGMDKTKSYVYTPATSDPIDIYKVGKRIEIERNGIRIAVRPQFISPIVKTLTQSEIDQWYNRGCISVRQTTEGDYVISAHGPISAVRYLATYGDN